MFHVHRGRRLAVTATAGLLAPLVLATTSVAGTSVPADAGPAANPSGYDWSDVDLSDVTLEVGQILPLTGGAASYADLFRNGSDLAAAQIAAAGGPTITFNRVDNASGTPEAAISAARQLVDDGTPIAQTSFPEASIAIVPIIDDAGLLTFNPAGATPEQLGAGEYLWMGGPDGQAPLRFMADYVHETSPEATTAAIIAWNTATGIAAGEEITARWEELGGSVDATELVDIGSSNVGPQIARALAGEPDVVFLVLFGPDNANVITALRDRGFEGTIMGSEFDPQFEAITGDADEGYVAITYALDPELDHPFNRLFVDGFRETYGTDPEPFASMFYENTWLIADLVARAVRAGADPNDREALYDAFIADPATPTSIIGTPYVWDTETHGYQRPFLVSVVEGHVAVPVGVIADGELQVGRTLADLAGA
ncbi:ABC transporter substrate-binding protein [Desertimonas flava]|uniref:ABC transporter substrate-binding protein n=1 Tax=Desertimonas flava TaxID=2064846 RepID=UPI000E34EAB2|nr:ABC transporter substrate-binding protein [Desertimonas flava]